VLRRLTPAIPALIVLLTATAAFAQQQPPPKAARDQYDQGEKAIKARNWDAAIAAFNAALAVDARDRTYRDSTITYGYFPHHYLFVAYSEKGDQAKAAENYAQRGAVPNDLARQEAPYVAKLSAVPTAPPVDRALAPYRAGVAAVKEKRWADAVTQLESAIKFSPNPSRDGDGYYPQLYLAMAYLKVGRAADARAAFDRRGTIPRELAADETRFSSEVEFAGLAAAADAAIANQQPQAAVDNWTKACTLLADECAAQGFRQKISDAQGAVTRNAAVADAARRVANARSLAADGKFDEALAEYKVVLAKDPGNAAAAAGSADIQTREKNYTDARARADRFARANDFPNAKREYDAALSAHAERFHREKLDAAVTSINDKLIAAQGVESLIQEAQKAFRGGNFAAAKHDAEAVLTKNPSNDDMKTIVARADSRLILDEGRKLAAAGEYVQADAKYREALTKDASNDAASSALETSVKYSAFVQQRLFPQARTADKVRFDRELPDQHFDTIEAINSANEAFLNTDYGTARKKIDAVLKNDPTNPNALGLSRKIVAALRRDLPPPGVTQPTSVETAPVLPLWMWGAIVAVTAAGAGSLLAVRSRTPVPVAIDALPWGRVSIQKGGRPAKAATGEKTTPFLVNLPPGEYDLQVTSESMSQPYTTRLLVVRGQSNRIVVINPAYDVDEIVSNLLG